MLTGYLQLLDLLIPLLLGPWLLLHLCLVHTNVYVGHVKLTKSSVP